MIKVIHNNTAVIHTSLIAFASKGALQNQMRVDEIKIRPAVITSLRYLILKQSSYVQ